METEAEGLSKGSSLGRIKLGAGVIRLGGVRLVGSFEELHAGDIKLWGIRLEKRVNLEYQALRKQVTGIKFWGSGWRNQAERGIRFERDQACGDPAWGDQDARG